jgi:hypothetical protein
MSSDNCEMRTKMVYRPNITAAQLNDVIKNDPDISVREAAQTQLNFMNKTFEGNSYSIPTEEYELFNQLEEKAKNTANLAELTQIYNEINQHPNFFPLLIPLAKNCNLNADLIHKIYIKAQTLKEGFKVQVFEALAANLQTPADVLFPLASEKNPKILQALAGNPNLPAAVMSWLLTYPNCIARKNLIMLNPNLTDTLLKQMTHDSDAMIRKLASDRLNQPQKLFIWQNQLQANPACAAKIAPMLQITPPMDTSSVMPGR